jgi:hypothetical protein
VNRACCWAADLLSRTLAPAEREAVLGDLAESGDSGVRALSSVFGLVIRRQAAPWSGWRPWLGLLGLALPSGLLLGFMVFVVDSALDLYLWIARNRATIDPATLEETGLRLRQGFMQFIASSLMLVSWSWVSGFVLGILSRGAMGWNGTAFYLALAWTAFAGISRSRPYQYGVAGWVFPLTFYTAILPLLLLATLVLVPSLHGICQSRRIATTGLRTAIPWAASMVAFVIAIEPSFWKVRAFGGLLVLAGYWPVGYLIAISLSKEKVRNENAGR